MSFGSKSVPSFYTVIVQTIREEWLLLFVEAKNNSSIDTPPPTLIYDDKNNHEYYITFYQSYVYTLSLIFLQSSICLMYKLCF